MSVHMEVLCDYICTNFLCCIQRFRETMAAIQGALIIASFFQMILGFLGFVRIFGRWVEAIKPIRIWNMCWIAITLFRQELDIDVVWCRYLSPLSSVPLVTLTGLGFFVLGFPLVSMLKFPLCYWSVDWNWLNFNQENYINRLFFFLKCECMASAM